MRVRAKSPSFLFFATSALPCLIIFMKDTMKKSLKTVLIVIFLTALSLPLAADDGPHVFIILSRDSDSYLTSLFIRDYIASFGVDAEIRRSLDDISREEMLRSGHPLAVRFWYQEDKVILRSEELRTGGLYFISSEYGRDVNPVDNRAWLTEALDALMYDLYLDGLIDQDPRMKSDASRGDSLKPVIFIERGFGDAVRWEGFLRDALISQGLDARLTPDSSEETVEEDEHAFSLRLWMLTEFMEVSVFDLADTAGEGCWYLDTETVGPGLDIEAWLSDTAMQMRRLMENDRNLLTEVEE